MTERLYGRQPVREALRAGRRRVQRVLVAEGVRDAVILDEILDLAQQQGGAVQWVARQELDRLGVNHQGVVLEASDYPYVDLAEIMSYADRQGEPPLLLALDHLEDPRNVGALLRTAEAVGVHGVLVPERRSASITPAASDTSAGAVEHLRVARITNLTRSLTELQRGGLWVAGLEAVEEAQIYRQVDLSGPLVLVVGSEGQGLGRLVREHCDWLVRLPMRGQVSSLNAAVAGSVLLYWILECRTKVKPI